MDSEGRNKGYLLKEKINKIKKWPEILGHFF
jgi:hypothetical protein